MSFFFAVASLSGVFDVVMSYQTAIDQMVAKHIAEYQREIATARQLQECDFTPPMPYGYPLGVYQPRMAKKAAPVHGGLATHCRKISNGVPWILGMDLVNQYTLGLYNPVKS